MGGMNMMAGRTRQEMSEGNMGGWGGGPPRGALTRRRQPRGVPGQEPQMNVAGAGAFGSPAPAPAPPPLSGREPMIGGFGGGMPGRNMAPPPMNAPPPPMNMAPPPVQSMGPPPMAPPPQAGPMPATPPIGGADSNDRLKRRNQAGQTGGGWGNVLGVG